METVGVGLIAVAVFGYFAWARYMSYRDAAALLERGVDPSTVIQWRERWATRAGLLQGAKLLVLGVLLFSLSSRFGRWIGAPDETWMIGFVGAFIAVFGLIVIVAYAIWSRRVGAGHGGGRLGASDRSRARE